MTIQTRSAPAPTLVPRSVQDAMRRGVSGQCPACGNGSIYRSYLKVVDNCPSCSEALHHHRADDAPPYFTMVIVGHIIVALVMYVEKAYAPELWVHALLWTPMILGMTLWMLPRIKGALIGLQWALRMHGFGAEGAEDPAAVPSEPLGR